MAHEIEVFDDGFASAAYAKEPAWHKLGYVAPDYMTGQELMAAADLDTEVRLQKVYAQIPRADGQTPIGGSALCPEHFATVRYGSKHDPAPKVLSVVGSVFQPFQTRQQFELLDDIVGSSDAHYDAAGSLYGGKRVFVSLKLPNDILFQGVDPMKLFLMSYNSFDGSQSLTFVITIVRTVCENTAQLALRTAKSLFRVRHTATTQVRAAQAREALELTFRYKDAFAEEVQKLMDGTFSRVQFDQLAEQLLPAPVGPQVTPRIKAYHAEALSTMKARWDSPTLDNIKDTQWAAFNAVTEYADWFAPVRAQDKATARATRLMTGATNAFKQKAYDLITS